MPRPDSHSIYRFTVLQHIISLCQQMKHIVKNKDKHKKSVCVHRLNNSLVSNPSELIRLVTLSFTPYHSLVDWMDGQNQASHITLQQHYGLAYKLCPFRLGRDQHFRRTRTEAQNNISNISIGNVICLSNILLYLRYMFFATHFQAKNNKFSLRCGGSIGTTRIFLFLT